MKDKINPFFVLEVLGSVLVLYGSNWLNLNVCKILQRAIYLLPRPVTLLLHFFYLHAADVFILFILVKLLGTYSRCNSMALKFIKMKHCYFMQDREVILPSCNQLTASDWISIPYQSHTNHSHSHNKEVYLNMTPTTYTDLTTPRLILLSPNQINALVFSATGCPTLSAEKTLDLWRGLNF